MSRTCMWGGTELFLALLRPRFQICIAPIICLLFSKLEKSSRLIRGAAWFKITLEAIPGGEISLVGAAPSAGATLGVLYQYCQFSMGIC